MSPHALENLHNKLGQPKWFWPLVMFALFVALPLLASYVEQA
jgi:uncharacterized membrane protein (DUF485 family)